MFVLRRPPFLHKALVTAAIVTVGGYLIFERDAFSYLRTWGASVRESVKGEVPIEFEVERAREMVEKLVPDIRDCMHVIAEQQVDIEYRAAEIASKENGMVRQRSNILTLRGDLDSGNSTFEYASRRYSCDDVKRDLALRFERYKTAEDSLRRDRQIVAAHQKSLIANEQKLDALLVSKQELEVKIEQLEARLKTVRAAEAASTLEFDDSRLARAKKLIRELNKQLDVKEKELDTHGKFTGLIPVDAQPEPSIEDVTIEIDAYFKKSVGEAPATVTILQVEPAA